MNQDNFSLSNIKRVTLRYVLPAILFILITWFILTFNFYTLNITSPTGAGSTAVTYTSGSNKSDSIRIFNTYLVPRSTDFIQVSQGSSITRLALQNKPIIGIKNENIEIKQQTTVSKIGADSLGCNGKTSAAAFTYRCFSSVSGVALFANRTSGELDNTILPDIQIKPLESHPYRDGILSIIGADEDDESSYSLVYTNVVTRETSIIPTTIKQGNSVKLEVDETGSSAFSIINTTNATVRYYQDLTSDYIQLKRSAAFNPNKDSVSCSLKQQVMACYYGVTTEPDIGSDTTREQQSLRRERGGSLGTVEYYNFSTKTTSSRPSGEKPLQTICSTSNGWLYALSGNTVLVASPNTESNKTIHFDSVANDATQLTCGQKAIYSTSKSLYTLTMNSAFLAFNEGRMRLSTIQSQGSTVIFNVYLEEDDSDGVAHTYTLNNTSLRTVRPERTLPYSAVSDSLILDMDYSDDTIYIKPAISVISDHAAGETIVDQELLLKTKQSIEDRLRQDGLLDKYKVVYSL